MILGIFAAGNFATSIFSSGVFGDEPKSRPYKIPGKGTSSGHLIEITDQGTTLPVAVVRGSPYEMGYQLGQLFSDKIRGVVPVLVESVSKEMGLTSSDLADVWARTAAYGDDRLEQELAGLADGSGVGLTTLQSMHAIPLLMPYSCSSIAAWGQATVDGHLYQTRNLDWNLEIGAHNHPMVVLYIPDQGVPHVVPSFAGMIGAHTGMNARGIALSEMGDASKKEAPYYVHAPHFTTFFRTMLYDSKSLSDAVSIFRVQRQTKRYHFVFGDGQSELGAVKVRTNASNPEAAEIEVWKDNDKSDEFYPNVLSCVVYNDEGRGAFPTLKTEMGKLDGPKLIALANKIPIKGGNVENVVYDATAFRMWVSYAKGSEEAYKRPYVFIDLKKLDANVNGIPDLDE
ncbi:MAG: C45 family autoproteolytic acyltransferase/hydrolase [Pirellula sp.]|nr:C45 family autoproteolytic acyltransferase/hydrolase [Pirellula sp.]